MSQSLGLVRIVRGFALISLGVALGGCASVPQRLQSPPQGAVLASAALERSVLPMGVYTEPQGILIDRQVWNRPVEEATARWSEVILGGWSALNPGAVDWPQNEQQKQDYSTITVVPDADSMFGFMQPDAVRFGVPAGWNYVGDDEKTKWAGLAKAWGVNAFWTLRAKALYILDDVPTSQQTYHVLLRTVVTLLDGEGKVLAQTTVVSNSASHPFVSLSSARTELPVTVPEAAKDFLLRWKALVQNE